MSSVVLSCPKCESRDVKTLNPEKANEVKEFLVNLDAECQKCEHKFKYTSSTKFGREMRIMY